MYNFYTFQKLIINGFETKQVLAFKKFLNITDFGIIPDLKIIITRRKLMERMGKYHESVRASF